MANNLKGKIEFIANQAPQVKDGKYDLTVSQTVTISGTKQDIPAATASFSIAGPRVALNPKNVKSVFPPARSFGNYANVLPHILLTATTLPWQRGISSNAAKTTPWMGLLVFDEAPDESTVQVQNLIPKSTKSPFYGPGLGTIAGLTPTDKVQVIDVNCGLLRNLLPSASDLEFLAHIRQPKNESGDNDGDPFSVIVANRLVPSSGKTTIHLVSLEDRYSGEGFDFQEAKSSDQIRLISLYKWSFSTISEKFDFQKVLAAVSTDSLQLPATSENPKVQAMLGSGKVGLPHEFRNGDQSVSWYSGPFRPDTASANSGAASLPTNGDSLLQFYHDMGMFDVSYAAAWELGRLLMLNNKSVSQALFLWRLETSQAQNMSATKAKAPHLIFGGTKSDQDSLVVATLPKEVSNFLSDLSKLKYIPFQYLVPVEDMLPVESIRFFQIDAQWIQRLLEGAFSIGQPPGTTAGTPETNVGALTGFLLRSEVVAGYPHLEVTGYLEQIGNNQPADESYVAYSPVRQEALSPNVLLCLFDRNIQTYDVHLKPEVLHFGIDPGNQKKLRNKEGEMTETVASVAVSNGRIDVSSLATEMSEKIKWPGRFNSAEFALEMIEGVENVRFTVKSN